MNNNINLSFDIKRPSIFLATYKFLLLKEKPHHNNSFIITTKRLLRSYLFAYKNLEKVLNTKAKGIFSFLKKRSEIRSKKAELKLLYSKLMNWVSVSLFSKLS